MGIGYLTSKKGNHSYDERVDIEDCRNFGLKGMSVEEWVFMDISTDKYPNTFTIIDKIDFEIVSKYKWLKSSKGYVTRTARNKDKTKSCLSLHRAIMFAKPGQIVDHVNRNPLDNRRCNLRFCTHSQNNMNSKTRNSKYKGAFKSKKGRTYFAAIGYKGKRLYIGCYATEKLAAIAYDGVANELYGEFAKLNFPKHNFFGIRP